MPTSISWQHTVIFDDSLNPLWRIAEQHATVDALHNRTTHSSKASSVATCSRSIHLSLKPTGSAIMKTEGAVRMHAALSVQFWAKPHTRALEVAQCQRKPRAFRYGCNAAVCISLRQSKASAAHALLLPLCAFGSLKLQGWSKLIVPTSLFAAQAGASFDEIVLLAGEAWRGSSMDLLLDDVMIMSSSRPPPSLNFPRLNLVATANKRGTIGLGSSKATRAGRCTYLASAIRAQSCRVWDSDHLTGQWVQTCAPEAIKRPDRYAYGRSLDHSVGQWDYRLCFKLGFSERARSRAALSWAWRPRHCELHAVDGALLSRWLGNRTMLFWGDSLTAQHFFSFVLMLGDAVESIRDVDPKDYDGVAQLVRGGAGRGSTCGYSGLGTEGGPLTEARLASGGRVLKVLGHVELVDQLRGIGGVWWRELMASADFIIFNLVGHHLRTIDGSFASHTSLVAEALRQLERGTKPTAQLIMRTSNVGHVKCEAEAQPLRSRGEAWQRLGGWKWQPPGFTPTYFGGELWQCAIRISRPHHLSVLAQCATSDLAFLPAPRDGADRYDWRAPPLHESQWARQAAASPLAQRFTILNVSHVDLRADGHVANAMRLHIDPRKALGASDCLHYCLPGPADAWSSALYNLLLNSGSRFAPRQRARGPSMRPRH